MNHESTVPIYSEQYCEPTAPIYSEQYQDPILRRDTKLRIKDKIQKKSDGGGVAKAYLDNEASCCYYITVIIVAALFLNVALGIVKIVYNQ